MTFVSNLSSSESSRGMDTPFVGAVRGYVNLVRPWSEGNWQYHSSDLSYHVLDDYLVRFVTNLDPNNGTEPSWPKYDNSSKQILWFTHDDDDTGVQVSTDDYRVPQLMYLTNLSLAYPLWIANVYLISILSTYWSKSHPSFIPFHLSLHRESMFFLLHSIPCPWGFCLTVIWCCVVLDVQSQVPLSIMYTYSNYLFSISIDNGQSPVNCQERLCCAQVNGKFSQWVLHIPQFRRN